MKPRVGRKGGRCRQGDRLPAERRHLLAILVFAVGADEHVSPGATGGSSLRPRSGLPWAAFAASHGPLDRRAAMESVAPTGSIKVEDEQP